jgi:uracil-DNA glycosylase
LLLLPDDWRGPLGDAIGAPWVAELQRQVAGERRSGAVFPPENDVFRAFWLTPFARVRVVLLGQDPYHGAGQAHGLCFSVPRGVKPPPSLRNILRELTDDLGVPPSGHGDLSAWAEHGMLLLNTVLTVREGAAGSHRRFGWERFTDAVISALSAQARPLVFVLWGNPAREKRGLIETTRHRVVEAAHPSPLSAHRGFLGTRPFSAIQSALTDLGQPAFDFRRD